MVIAKWFQLPRVVCCIKIFFQSTSPCHVCVSSVSGKDFDYKLGPTIIKIVFPACQWDRRWGQSWTDTCKFVRHLGLASCAIVKMKVRLGYVHENESRSIAFFLISNTKKKPKYLQFWLYFLWWHKSAFISQKHSQTPLLRPDSAFVLPLSWFSIHFYAAFAFSKVRVEVTSAKPWLCV